MQPESQRRIRVTFVAVVCVVVVASVAIGLAGRHHSRASEGRTRPNGSERAVLAALAKTVAVAHFDLAYTLTESPVATPRSTPTNCGTSPVSFETGCVGSSDELSVSVSGAGTVRTKPFAMTISADVRGIGNFSIWVDGTRGSGSFATGDESNPVPTGVGSPLAANEGLVEGTLGPRAGAVAMLGLASPTGFLDLDRQAVTGAAESGTGTVNNFLVTDYKVSIDVARLRLAAGITPAETAVIRHALALLHAQGSRNLTVTVSIDAAGLIRRARSVTHFADGDSVTLERTLSNFAA